MNRQLLLTREDNFLKTKYINHRIDRDAIVYEK